MDMGKVLLGTIAGFAAGVLVGVLFAPHKGGVTRRKLTKKGADYMDDLKDKFDEFVDDMTDKFETLYNQEEELTEKVKDKSGSAGKTKKSVVS
jgi:gas vesicle protein